MQYPPTDLRPDDATEVPIKQHDSMVRTTSTHATGTTAPEPSIGGPRQIRDQYAPGTPAPEPSIGGPRQISAHDKQELEEACKTSSEDLLL